MPQNENPYALLLRPEVTLEEGLRRTLEHMRARGLAGGERYHV